MRPSQSAPGRAADGGARALAVAAVAALVLTWIPGAWAGVAPSPAPETPLVPPASAAAAASLTQLPGVPAGGAPTWIDLTSHYSSAPATRAFPNMAWDVGDQYALLFGGENGGLSPDGDTWSFTPANGWHQVCNSCAPSGRAEAQMAYDSTDGEMVMNGGCTGLSNCPIAETWTYAQGSWHTSTAGTPPIQDMAGSMSDDPADGAVVMYGGCSNFQINIINPGASACASNAFLANTWTFTASAGWSAASPSLHPSSREAAGMVYDPVAHEVVLYGGYDGTSAWNDTWAFHAGQWFQLHPVSNPGPMANFGMFWDPQLQEVVILTPDNGSPTGGTTWALSAGNWTQLFPAAHPAPRDGEVIASPPTGFPVLFGGETNGSTNQGDTWAFGVPLAAQVSATPAATDVGQSVAFTAQVGGGQPPYTLSWAFGDGSTSTVANTTHAYSTPNPAYAAVFTVGDSYGLSASQSATLNITAVPVVAAAASPATGGTGNLTSFWANATGGAGALTYSWSFGDGGTSALPDPTHVYQTPGAFQAKVVVSDAVGLLASSTVNLTEKAPPGSVVVTLVATPTSGVAPLSVQFVSSVAGGRGPYTFAWDLGDGTTSTLPNVTHIYVSGGSFPATLTVTDATGKSGNYSVTINVQASPMVVQVTATPRQGDAPLTVAFNENVSGGEAPFVFNWSFGDGSWDGVDPTVLHTYATPPAMEPFQATFTVSDAITDGQRQQVGVNVSVAPPLVVSAPLSTPGSPGPGDTVSMSVAVVGGMPPYTFSWAYGDGSAPGLTGSTNASQHAYAQDGAYTLNVTVTDAYGVASSAHTTITVGSAAPAGHVPVSALFQDPTAVEYLLFPAVVAMLLGATLFVGTEGGRRRRRPPMGGPRAAPPSHAYAEPAYYLTPGWR